MYFFNNLDTDKRKALLALSITSIIWGISTPLIKWALLVTPVFLLAFLRFFLASIILVFLKPRLKIQRKDLWKIVAAAFFGTFLNITFLFVGLNLSTAINAAIIIATIPLLTLLFSALFLHEKMTGNLLFGSLLGLTGVFVVIYNGGLSTGILGNILLLLAAISWVFYEILGKNLSQRYEAKTIIFYSFLIGGLTFLPFAYNDLFVKLPQLYLLPQFYISLIIIVIFTSLISYLLWQWSLSKLDASRVGFFLYINPIVVAIVSFFLLNESITPHFLFGAILVFGGLYIGEKTIHLPSVHLAYHIFKKDKVDKNDNNTEDSENKSLNT